jgi:fibronectin type 3 domain-containing protein
MKLNSKVIVYSIAILLLLSSSLVVLASDPVSADTAGDYTFNNDGTYATITGYSGSDGVVTIPASLGGFTTSAIGDSAFSNHPEMTSVIIPSGVNAIGNSAFAGCTSLTSITFQGVTAPTSVGASWIQGTDPSIRGHAPVGSNYGTNFNGLTVLMPPSAPANLQATPGNGYIVLTWTPPSDGGSSLTGYLVWLLENGNPVYSGNSAYNPPGTATSTTISGLSNNQNYTFQMAAINGEGQGPSSQSVTAMPRTIPGQPTLTATPGNAKVTLSWTAPANNGAVIDYYIIYQNGAALPTHPSGLTFEVDGLQNGIPYNFAVAAHNAAGVGTISSTVSSTPRTVPGAPTSLNAAPSDGQIALSWSAPSSTGGSDITGYKVYKSSSQTGPYSLISSALSLSYTDSSLNNGVTYYYEVSAFNVAGEGPNATISSAAGTVPGAPVMSPPTEGNAFVDLIWQAPSTTGGTGITGYKVWRSDSQAGTYSLISSTLPTSLSYHDTAVTNGQTYWYAVSATNGNGEGSRSGPLSATPRTVPDAPVLTLTPGNGQISLSWTAPFNGGSQITVYNVYRSLADPISYSLIASPTGLTYIDANVSNGVTYVYQVSAVNAAGEGQRSSSSVPSGVMGVPGGFVAVAGNASNVLSWTAPTGNGGSVLSYNVYRSTAQAGPYTLAGSPTGLTYTDAGLINGQNYWYEVSAVNAGGEGPKSTPISSIPYTVPSKPTGLMPSSGNGQVTLNWTAPFDGGRAIDYFVVYQNGQVIAHRNASQLSYTITLLTNGQTYEFMVAAHNIAGLGENSLSATAVPSLSMLVTIISPATNSYVTTSNVNLRWIISSGTAGMRYDISLDGNIPISITSGALNMTLMGLAQGNHTVVLRATSNAGKTNFTSTHFTVDSIKPKLTILAPDASSWSNVTMQTASWTATDTGSGMAYYWVRLDNGPWTNTTALSKVFAGLASAQHTLYVRAYDRAGNYNETAWLFFVDTTLPTITFVSPVQGGAVNSHTVGVTWTGYDLAHIARYLIQMDGGAWRDMGLATTSSFANLSEGSHNLTIRAQDTAGNWNISTITFAVDLTPPTVVAHYPVGADAAMIGTVASVTVTFSEKMDPNSVRISVNGKSGNVSSPDQLNFMAMFTLSYNLNCTVTMSGTDLAGNPVDQTWHFTTIKNEGSIEGVLKGKNGEPIVNATVTLSNGMTTQTDSNGHFKFTNVTGGTLVLKGTKDGYASITQTVTSTPGKTNNLGPLSLVSPGSASDGGVFFVTLATLAIAILVLTLIIRRRSRSPGAHGTRPDGKGPNNFKENVRSVYMGELTANEPVEAAPPNFEAVPKEIVYMPESPPYSGGATPPADDFGSEVNDRNRKR